MKWVAEISALQSALEGMVQAWAGSDEHRRDGLDELSEDFLAWSREAWAKVDCLELLQMACRIRQGLHALCPASELWESMGQALSLATVRMWQATRALELSKIPGLRNEEQSEWLDFSRSEYGSGGLMWLGSGGFITVIPGLSPYRWHLMGSLPQPSFSCKKGN